MPPPQRYWIKSGCFGPRQDNGLIAADTGSPVVRMRITTAKGQIVFAANNKESERRMQSVEALEIDEAAVHDDERAGLWLELVEQDYFVNGAAGDCNQDGDGAVNFQQRV